MQPLIARNIARQLEFTPDGSGAYTLEGSSFSDTQALEALGVRYDAMTMRTDGTPTSIRVDDTESLSILANIGNQSPGMDEHASVKKIKIYRADDADTETGLRAYRPDGTPRPDQSLGKGRNRLRVRRDDSPNER